MMSIDLEPRPENHVGTLTLRRYLAGELDDSTRADLEQRIEEDSELQARVRAIEEEHESFTADISFERFAGGVERAQRERETRKLSGGWFGRRMAFAGTGLAAAAVIAIFVMQPEGRQRNRTRGAADTIEEISVQIAPGDGGAQRTAHMFEVLGEGDRLRVGYACKTTVPADLCKGVRHLIVMSVDETGEVSAIYPEAGNALAVEPGVETVYLPDSFEFFGEGHEVLLVLMADEAFTVDAARRIARARFDKSRGNLQDTGAWRDLAGQAGPSGLQSHPFLFRKP